MNPETLKFDICLYHNNCADGTGAAYPFWRIHSGNDNFRLLPVDYDKPWPKCIKNKNVVIVDFSYKRDKLFKMSKICKSILILDHHKSAEENLTGIDKELDNVSYIFDMNKSGAQISWNYCYPGIDTPWFIEYIADRDLWKWELKNSKEINKAMFIGNWYNFEKLEELYIQSESKELLINKFIEQGNLLLNYEKILINNAINCAVKCKFEGYVVLLTTCDYSIKSEVGNILSNLDGIDFSATWTYIYNTNEWRISLRGGNNCDIPLHKIAEKFGGGGHPRSCGFTLRDDIHKYFKVIEE